jgi:hypothetical protein
VDVEKFVINGNEREVDEDEGISIYCWTLGGEGEPRRQSDAIPGQHA